MGKKTLKKSEQQNLLAQLLEQERGQTEMYKQLLAAANTRYEKLMEQVAEMELQKEAEQRCERTAVQGQLGHRAFLYKGMVAAAKQHILAERRIKELEAEVAVFKSVRVAS